MKLPKPTVERLSKYRRVLLNCQNNNKYYIFSHELAVILNLTAVQVRRDIMLMGFTRKNTKGYIVSEMITAISNIIDDEVTVNVAVIGMGNLGKAISSYLLGKRQKLNIIAAFDIDPEKHNKVISGIKCYDMNSSENIIRELNITTAILTVPAEVAQGIVNKLVYAGIKGILNFTSVTIAEIPGVFIEETDMITTLEKVVYFSK